MRTRVAARLILALLLMSLPSQLSALIYDVRMGEYVHAQFLGA